MLQLVICKAHFMAGQRGWNSIKALQSMFLSERGKPLRRHTGRQLLKHCLANHGKGQAGGRKEGRMGWDGTGQDRTGQQKAETEIGPAVH